VRIAEAEVAEVVAHEARIDIALLSRDADLAELDIQSLEIVEIIFALEDRFGIEIPYNANSAASKTTGISLKTVGDIVDMVNRLANEQLREVAVG
jgi:acyl carrier protein